MKASPAVFAAHVCFMLCLVLNSGPALAAPAPLKVVPGNLTTLLRSGTMAGGEAHQSEISLLAVESLKQSQGERLTLSFGDHTGQPLQGKIGYFHIALDRSGKRLVIDLSHIARTAVDPSQLKKILSKSALVDGSDMTMDPSDGSTNITLNFKAPVQLTVRPTGKDNKLVLDLIQ